MPIDSIENIFLPSVHPSAFISPQTIFSDAGEKVPISMTGAALALHLAAAAPAYYLALQNVVC